MHRPKSVASNVFQTLKYSVKQTDLVSYNGAEASSLYYSLKPMQNVFVLLSGLEAPCRVLREMSRDFIIALKLRQLLQCNADCGKMANNALENKMLKLKFKSVHLCTFL